MPAKKYHVSLAKPERERLARLSVSQKRSARERKRARILLLADEARDGGAAKDAAIAIQVRVDTLTVSRVRQRFAERGLEAALCHKEQQRRKPRVLDGGAEAHLVALVCGAPPDGRKRWSLHLLKDTLIEQRVVDAVSHETVRQTLKKTNSSPG